MNWLKHAHVTCVILSGAGYFMRGVGMMRGSAWLQSKAARVPPHVIDTVLLASAIALAWQIRQYPFVHGSLTAKVLGLAGYVVLGAIGLKYGRTRKIRISAWLAALMLFLYIVLVGLTRQVLPFIA